MIKLSEHIDNLNKTVASTKDMQEQYADAELDEKTLIFSSRSLALKDCDSVRLHIRDGVTFMQLGRELKEEAVIYRQDALEGMPVGYFLEKLQKAFPEQYRQLLNMAQLVQDHFDAEVKKSHENHPLRAALAQLLGASDIDCGNPFCPTHGVGVFKNNPPAPPSDNQN